MITLLIIIAAFFLVFSGALLVPLQLELNSEEERYRVRLFGYTSARLITKGTEWMIRIRVLFVPFSYYPFRHRKKTDDNLEQKKNKTVSAGRRRRMGLRTGLALIKKLLGSFSVKKLIAEIDTGDYPLNAQLFPLAQAISTDGKEVTINFKNKNSIDLLIETRLYKILWIAVKTFLINKNQKSWKTK